MEKFRFMPQVKWADDAQNGRTQPGTKLYTHAEPAEVERLRAVVNRCRNRVSKVITDKLKLRLERDNLRAQLVEAHALLAEARTLLHQVTALGGKKIGTLYSHSIHMGHRIGAALSASAEPSNDLCAEGAHEFVPFSGECVKCGEPYSAEPSAPAEVDERADIRSRLICADHCKECGHPDCNGQCYGDDMMGDS